MRWTVTGCFLKIAYRNSYLKVSPPPSVWFADKAVWSLLFSWGPGAAGRMNERSAWVHRLQVLLCVLLRKHIKHTTHTCEPLPVEERTVVGSLTSVFLFWIICAGLRESVMWCFSSNHLSGTEHLWSCIKHCEKHLIPYTYKEWMWPLKQNDLHMHGFTFFVERERSRRKWQTGSKTRLSEAVVCISQYLAQYSRLCQVWKYD